MKLLVFDTSFGACSVAVIEVSDGAGNGARLSNPAPAIACCYEPMDTGQAVRLMPMIDEVMRRAEVSFGDLGAIATSNGPGTFTGVRIAVASARALSLSTGLPVFGFSSLALIASKALSVLGASDKNLAICACMDARRDELYVQLFSQSVREPLSPPRLLDSERAAQLVNEPVIVVGTGASILYKAASALNQPVELGLEDLQPDATFSSTIHFGQFSPLRPLYLRRPDAKPQTGKAILRVSP